jgi:hypothetical protein
MQPSDDMAHTDRSLLVCPECGGLRWYVKDVQAPERQSSLVVAYVCQGCYTTVRIQYSSSEQGWTVAAEQLLPPSGGSSTAPPSQ